MSELPQNIKDRIEKEAEQFTNRFLNFKVNTRDSTIIQESHAVGATTWAERGQKLADALEWIKTYGPCDSLTVKFIDKNLAEWNQIGKEEVGNPIEYMPVHPEDAKKSGCPKQVPMSLLNEEQAYSNHLQTLQRLKERGGLSVKEILCVINKRPWNHYRDMPFDEALNQLETILKGGQQ